MDCTLSKISHFFINLIVTIFQKEDGIKKKKKKIKRQLGTLQEVSQESSLCYPHEKLYLSAFLLSSTDTKQLS